MRCLPAMGHQPKRLLADRAYDASRLGDVLAGPRIKAVIPPNQTRNRHHYDKAAYRDAMSSRGRSAAQGVPAYRNPL